MVDDNQQDPVPTLAVAAAATVDAVPDEAQIHFNLRADGRSSTAALDAVRQRLGTFDGICDRLDIDAADRSSSVSVSEQGERDGGKWLSKGYRATARVKVVVHDVELVGSLVNEAVESVGPAVHGPYWQVTPDHPARLEACAKAATQAKQKAAAYAAALQLELGEIMAVTEPGVEAMPVTRGLGRSPAMSVGASGDAGEDPVIDLHPGTQQVQADVEITFRIHAP